MSNEKTCKVVLVGESGVGKTSIISRYVSDTFSAVLVSTTGACFSSKTIPYENNVDINFEIWDTAGQERYRALTKVFYKSATVCILVYDITRKNSFEELRKYWISEIKENASEGIILAVVGNKSDMYEFEQVSTNDGMKFAQDVGAIFQLTSAKKSLGIDDLFLSIGEKFVHPDKEINSNLTKEQMESKRRQKLINDVKEEEKKKKKGCC